MRYEPDPTQTQDRPSWRPRSLTPLVVRGSSHPGVAGPSSSLEHLGSGGTTQSLPTPPCAPDACLVAHPWDSERELIMMGAQFAPLLIHKIVCVGGGGGGGGGLSLNSV